MASVSHLNVERVAGGYYNWEGVLLGVCVFKGKKYLVHLHLPQGQDIENQEPK